MDTRPQRLHQAVAFKLRGALMVPPIAFLFASKLWEWEYDPGVWLLGLGLFVPGVALRVWAQRYLRYRLRDRKKLAIDGPYTRTRNPVYLGNMLLLAGLCVLCELPWAIPLVVGWAALVYDAAVRFEEGRLAKRYDGEYADYCRRVPRWLPLRLPATSRIVPVASLWRAFGVEWQCLLLLIIPIVKEAIY